jgi:ribonucleoside-diphosphate reductase alpha chain
MVDPKALLVLQKRYLIRNEAGEVIESPEAMCARVAKAVAEAEKHYDPGAAGPTAEKFSEMMAALEFLPNSPTLMNGGRELGQLAACFVLPVDDTLDSIFNTVKETAKIHQTGGGTGFSFSRLRPRDDVVASTMGVASGPVSFMKVFNMATEVVKQGGTRRGANMGVLRVDHPDIEEFVSIKSTPGELTNFNLSVALTDRFMRACEQDGPFSLVNPRTKKAVKTVRARDLSMLIADSAWLSGEPGVLFIDTINRANPTPLAGEIEATNPCGEQPLLPYESCCLGSINLSRLVRDRGIDWKRLEEVVHLGVRFLDDVIDVNRYPLPEIERVTMANRKIGLGVMGFAHMLIKLGIEYDSDRGEQVAEAVMTFIERASKTASGLLARSRGEFPNYRGSVWEKGGMPQRNATTTTIAPTGTLSIIAGTSSGIEPIYETKYRRVLFGDTEVEVVDPLYEELGRLPGKDGAERLFKGAVQIPPFRHLAMQKRFQLHVDNGVSKTINLPQPETPDKVLAIYREAYRLGLKGTTVFRDRSREHQVLSCGRGQIC